jgi:hypothetical protein
VPYDVRIEELSRTIVITGTGSGTTADTLAEIAAQQQNFRDHPGFNLLYDSSAMTIESSAADMIAVANALFTASGAAFGRIAVVVPHSREALARIFAALAHPHGIDANVFSDALDARRWLGIEPG